MEQTTDQNATKQNRQCFNAFARDERDHNRQKRKARTLNHGQFGTDGSNADGLNQRGDACEDHRHLDHVDHRADIGRTEPNSGSDRDNDRGSDVRNEHREDMLNPQWNRLGDRGCVVGVAELFRRT